MSSRNYQKAQHFLRSPRLAHELIGHSSIKKRDIVLDLGAGSGVISSALAKRAERVIAVENDTATVEKLRQNLKPHKNVTIIQDDILSVSPPNLPYKIFANIPFSLSSKIVWRFTRLDNSPSAMYLIVQSQFARKLVPGNDHFTSQMAAQIQPWWTVKIRKPLKKYDFTPPPAVDTVFIEITQRADPLVPNEQRDAFQDFIARCFSRQAYFTSLNRGAAHIEVDKRPSQLTIDEWLRLFTL